MHNRGFDFNKAQEIVKAAYPEYRLEKNGELIDGVYVFWGKATKPVGVPSFDSIELAQFFAEEGIDLSNRFDDSRKDYISKSFGVDKSTGEILLDHGRGWWSKDKVPVAALTADDILQVEEEVIATGLCRRDEYGRVVTNSGDCYLTLVDGNSVWIPLVPVDDYNAGFYQTSAVRPEVRASSYRVGDGKGGWVNHCWRIWFTGAFEDWLRRHNPKNNPLDRNFPSDEQLPEWAFCIVGNVIEERLSGRDKRVVQGTKHFSPGAKLFILDRSWGMGGERMLVMGRPRNKKTLIKIVLERSLIHNFRVKQVYDRRVIRELFLPFGYADLQTSELKEKLRELVGYWNTNAEVLAAEFRKQVEQSQKNDKDD